MTHPLELRNYAGRFVMNGLSRTTWLWGILSWEGQDAEKWHILPDGRDVYEALQGSGLEALPEKHWIKVTNTGEHPDIIWTGAGLFCFVSQRLLRVLDDCDVSGYRATPLELRPKRGVAVHGYSMLYFNDADADEIRPYPPGNRFSDRFDGSARVKEALAEAGVTNLEIDDAAERTRLALATL
jgi:hypothetical protein